MDKPVLNPAGSIVVTSLAELEASVEKNPAELFALVLRYDADVKAHGTKALAASPALARVNALTLNRCGLDGKSIRTLLRSPHLQNVCALDLSDHFSHDPGAKAVAQWEGLSGVTHLWLHHTAVYAKGVKELCASPHTTALRELVLNGNNIKAPGVKALVAAPFASRLERLALARNPFGNSGVKALGALAGVGRELDLFSVEMTHLGLKALLGNPALAGVERLRLGHNELGDKGAAMLVKTGLPAGLRELDLTGTGLSDAGLTLLDDPALAQLELLDLHQFTPVAQATTDRLLSSEHIGAAVQAAWDARARVAAEQDR